MEMTHAQRGAVPADFSCRLRRAWVPSRPPKHRPGCPMQVFWGCGARTCGKQFTVCTAVGLGHSADGFRSQD